MSPRQIMGFLELEAAEEKRHQAQFLSLTALATQGSEKDINATLKDLQRQ